MPTDDYFQEYGPIRRRRAQPGADPEAPRPPAPDEEPPPPRRPPPRRPRRRPTSPFSLLTGVLLTVVALLIFVPLGIQLRYRNQALPGVSIHGLAVGGQDETTIRAALAARYGAFLRQPLALAFGAERWQPTLAELGVRFDPNQLATQALSVGRTGNPIENVRTLWAIGRGGYDLTPVLSVDLPTLQAYLATIATRIEQPPQDAALSLAAGKVLGTPSREGRQVLVDATATDVLFALRSLVSNEVTLRTRQLVPAINDVALKQAEERAQRLLRAPLDLTLGSERWTWPTDRIAELVRVEPLTQSLAVNIDAERLQRAVERLAQTFDSGSVEPRLRFAGGKLQIVRAGQIGRRLKQAETVRAISQTLELTTPLTRSVALVAEDVRPRITASDLDNLGVKELVGVGQSSFAGSAAYRITNIKAGVARFDGVLIGPGEEFSFNTQIGEINAENGFVEGYAIIGNRTRLEWGGGICQDSTTVFRAAFWAGLPITERHTHAFYISWYDQYGLGAAGDGAGLDASIYTGLNDMRFINDTNHWLLLQATVNDAAQVLTVELYGTRPARRVAIDGPYISNVVPAPPQPVYYEDAELPMGTIHQTDVARSGRDILISRVITNADGSEQRDDFFTRFKAWPNVFVRGTG